MAAIALQQAIQGLLGGGAAGAATGPSTTPQDIQRTLDKLFPKDHSADIVRPGTSEYNELFPSSKDKVVASTLFDAIGGLTQKEKELLSRGPEALTDIVTNKYASETDQDTAATILDSLGYGVEFSKNDQGFRVGTVTPPAPSSVAGFPSTVTIPSGSPEAAAYDQYADRGIYNRSAPDASGNVTYTVNPQAAHANAGALQEAQDRRTPREPLPIDILDTTPTAEGPGQLAASYADAARQRGQEAAGARYQGIADQQAAQNRAQGQAAAGARYQGLADQHAADARARGQSAEGARYTGLADQFAGQVAAPFAGTQAGDFDFGTGAAAEDARLAAIPSFAGEGSIYGNVQPQVGADPRAIAPTAAGPGQLDLAQRDANLQRGQDAASARYTGLADQFAADARARGQAAETSRYQGLANQAAAEEARLAAIPSNIGEGSIYGDIAPTFGASPTPVAPTGGEGLGAIPDILVPDLPALATRTEGATGYEPTTTARSYNDIIFGIQNATTQEQLAGRIASAGDAASDPAVAQAIEQARSRLGTITGGESDAAQFLIAQAASRGRNQARTGQPASPSFDSQVVADETSRNQQAYENAAFGQPAAVASAAGTGTTGGGPAGGGGVNTTVVADDNSATFSNLASQLTGNPAQGGLISNLVNRITKGRNAGFGDDAIAGELRRQAQNARGTANEAALLSLGAALTTGAYNEMIKNAAQAGGGLERAYSPQLNISDPLNKALDLSREGETDAAAFEAKAVARGEERKATELQKFGSLQQNANSILLSDDEGNPVTLASLKGSDPDLYNQTVRFLSQANPDEVSEFINSTGIQNLPNSVYGIESTGAGDYQKERDKLAGKSDELKAQYSTGYNQNQIAATSNISGTVIEDNAQKRHSANRNYSEGWDNKRFRPDTVPNEGLGRFGPGANNFLGSASLTNGLQQAFYVDDDGTVKINRTNQVLKHLPWTEAQAQDPAVFYNNLAQAAGITGLAGVETLTELFEKKGGKPGLFTDDKTAVDWFAKGLDYSAQLAFEYTPNGQPVSAAAVYINRYNQAHGSGGGQAYIENVLARDIDPNRIVTDPESKRPYTVLDGKVIWLDQ